MSTIAGAGKPPATSKKASSSHRTPAPFLVSHFSIFNWGEKDEGRQPKSKKTSSATRSREYDGLPAPGRRQWQNEEASPPCSALPPLTPSVTISVSRGKKSGMPENIPRKGGSEKLEEKDHQGARYFLPLRHRTRADEASKTSAPSLSMPSSPASAKRKWFGFRLGGSRPSLAAQREGSIEANGVKRKSNEFLGAELAPPTREGSRQLSFSERIKLHRGLRTGKIPVDLFRRSQSQILHTEKEQTEKTNKPSAAEKNDLNKEARRPGAFCSDSTNDLDTYYLTEALFNLADAQPIVARSIPKHYVAQISEETKTRERLRKGCLFNEEIYDQMLYDSQHVLDMLQSHLTDCITGVRAKSSTALSSPFSSPPMTPILSKSKSSSLRPASQTRSPTPATEPVRRGTAISPPISPPRVRIVVSNTSPRPTTGGLAQIRRSTGLSSSLSVSSSNAMTASSNHLTAYSPNTRGAPVDAASLPPPTGSKWSIPASSSFYNYNHNQPSPFPVTRQEQSSSPFDTIKQNSGGRPSRRYQYYAV